MPENEPNPPNMGQAQGQGSAMPDNILFIAREPEESAGYDIVGLEETTGERGTSFRLSQVRMAQVSQPLLDAFLLHDIPPYLQSSPSRHVHVVVSTRSGTGLALEFFYSVLQPLLGRLGLSMANSSGESDSAAISPSKPNTYSVVITQAAESIRRFAQKLGDHVSCGVGHTVILLSGDGGITEMLNGKASTDSTGTPGSLPLIAMLPLGTGNALFHSTHKAATQPVGSSEPSTLAQAIRTLLKGRAAPLPSFRASFSPGAFEVTYEKSSSAVAELEEHVTSVSRLYGAIVASYGFHAQLVWESDTPAYRKHGDKRFGMVAQELLKESHAYDTSVEVASCDGSPAQKLDRERYAYVLATMVSNLEKTFTISPSSEPLDGKLRLVHFGPVGGEKTMQIMMAAYDSGKHIGMRWSGSDGKEEKVGYDQVAEVKVNIREHDARWRKVCIDGTIVEIPEGGHMVITKSDESCLQILTSEAYI
ncbi:ATP-NAD kinase-like domain-containing protein [Xylariomycetidae sp. FL2044]|nr:ATP-NAD kinase-like domain-containing protein [Xylariomycetidae sp. FL2044]